MKPKSSTNYKKIVDAVLDQINHGQLQKGDKLPTELSLATKFDVSRTCVREAIKSLEAMGIVQSIQGSGSYITNTPELSINRPICALFALSNSTLENVLDLRIVLETVTDMNARKGIGCCSRFFYAQKAFVLLEYIFRKAETE